MRFAAVVAQALAQAADLDVDGAVEGAGFAAVDQLAQLIAGEHAVGVVEQDAQQPGGAGGSDASSSGPSGASGDSNAGSGSSGSTSGGSTGSGTGGDTNSGGLSAAEEESIHSWLVTKYNMLDGYVARANSVVSTYNATGDTGPCDSLVNDMFVIRAEFGRQTFPPQSKWYRQFANLWGCYTNLCQWVGHYGDDNVALNNFNNNVAAIAL